MKNIDKELYKYIGSSIIITIVIIVMIYMLVINILQNRFNKIYQTTNLIVDINPTIDRTIEKIIDINGVNAPENKINVTNTSDQTIYYQIEMTPLNKDAEYIRLDIDDLMIRNLNNFSSENNSYILGNYSIPGGYTALHTVKLWLDYSISPYQSKKCSFKLTVKEA